MTPAGWVLMTVSVTGILVFTAYCFYRVLRAPVTRDHLHAPLEIDTREKR